MDLNAVLKATDLFSDLEPHELEAVAKCVTEREVAAEETVITEGASGDSLFLVLEGRVKIEKDADGKKLQLAELGEGAVFGEMSLIDAIPTSATVTALEATKLLAIGRLDLNVLLNWDTILASKMWRRFTLLLSQRLRDTNDRVLAKFGADAMTD